MVARNHKLPRVFGACALSLACALVGCGGNAGSSGSVQDEAEQNTSVSTEDASQKVEVPEALTDTVEMTKGIVSNNDTSDAEDTEELPELSDDVAQPQKDAGDEVAEGLDSADKAPTGTVLLTSGGVQMQVPSSWFTAEDEDGFVLKDSNMQVTGYLYGVPKQSGASYDVEALVKSIPANAAKKGFTNVQVGAYDTHYSASGKLCGASICYSAQSGSDEYLFYAELIESKSYLNMLTFTGPSKAFANEVNDIAAMANSLAFSSGEAI